MNVYALLPLIATIAYIPLLITTASSRPMRTRHKLFIIFLALAMMWSLIEYLFIGNAFPEYNDLLFRLLFISFAIMSVQFHCFLSSFYPRGRGRWLPFAYGSLVVMVVVVILGYATGEIEVHDGIVHGNYRLGVYLVFTCLMILAIRNYQVLWGMLKHLDNPVLYNQVISLILGVSVLLFFTAMSLLPFTGIFPLSHLGNLVNAFILSYAVIRHRLVDIRIVLRQGSAWLSLGIMGTVTFWLLLIVLHGIFNYELDLSASFAATVVGLLVAIFIYRIRGVLFEFTSRVFQGSSYDHRQKLSEFTNTIHNVFSLKGQGGELLALLTKAIGIKQACLLFHEVGSEDFNTQFAEPKGEENELSGLKLRDDNPIVKYLEREQKPLSRENLVILPEFMGMWEKEKEEIVSKDIEMIMPLISRERLIAILVLGKKESGRYSLEDFTLIEEITNRVAVSMEKEYLREQLKEREEELSIINRSSAIITSSLDIQEIYDVFIEELKKVIDVSWTAIVLGQENNLYFLALASDVGTEWQTGEIVSTEDSGTEWVMKYKEPIYETDIQKDSRFTPTNRYLQLGLRSVVHLPLVVKGEAIGSFIVASRQPHAYNQRHILLLEQLAYQIAMPIGNAQLYAEVEQKARNDELTGLLNRRSLDEMIDNEISRHSRYGGVFSLAILDLDSFKAFNDSYGHLAGDKLLRRVGRIIKGAVRNADRAFRYGGDEFAILLPQTTMEAAMQVMERVRGKIEAETISGKINVTASIGLASWPNDGIGQTEIIAAADLTLYRAKRSGGNRSYSASGALLPLDFHESNKDAEGSTDSKTLNAIFSLAETVDSRTHFTRNHSKKVAEYALALGEEIGWKKTKLNILETCALLHDVGKIGISDEILNKPGELNAEEWEAVKVHPQVGAAIVGRVPQFKHCVEGIIYHHEQYNGGGYPKGLKGNAIPLNARILAIADAFAAMTSDRHYSGDLTYENALEQLTQGSGKQFDPDLVNKFISVCEKRYIAAVNKDTRR